LRRRGADATTTAEAGLLTATDDQQLAHALATGRVLVTQDRDILRLNSQGVPHAGVAYCDKNTRTVGQMIQGLVLIWEILTPEEIAGRVEFL
jgi:hypothetical protein